MKKLRYKKRTITATANCRHWSFQGDFSLEALPQQPDSLQLRAVLAGALDVKWRFLSKSCPDVLSASTYQRSKAGPEDGRKLARNVDYDTNKHLNFFLHFRTGLGSRELFSSKVGC